MTLLSTPWPVDRTIPNSEWAPPTDAVVISADDHIMETDLWIDRMPSADRDRAPRITQDETGFHLSLEGKSADAPGFNSLVVEGRPGAVDVEQRLIDMDAEHVDASLLFSQRTMAFFPLIEDPEFLFRVMDAYNEWLADIQASGKGRLYGVAILPTMYAPEKTTDYIQKLKDLGFISMQLPYKPRNVRYNSSAMEPMWDAIEASGIPLSFHVGAGSSLRGAGALGTSITMALQPFRELWCLLAFSGILERHPEMKVVFTEGGISWIPATLFDADKQYKAFSTEVRPKLAELPSYYWFRQCYSTFMNDPSGVKLADDIGIGHMLWSIDYPHPEGNLGETVEVMRSLFDQLGDENARAVIGGNAVGIWDFDVDRILSSSRAGR